MSNTKSNSNAKTAATAATAKTSTAAKTATSEKVVEKVELKLPTDEQMRKDGMSTLSARIRHLDSLGATRSEICKVVKRANGEHPLYQHVRGVLITPLKRDEVVEDSKENQTKA